MREAYLHALALLGNREDAIDACQDSFANAFAALRRLGALTAFYLWFYRVLRNCCLNRLARRRTELPHAREALASEPEPAAGPDASLSLDEERARIWECLAELSLEHREILALRYLRDNDFECYKALLSGFLDRELTAEETWSSTSISSAARAAATTTNRCAGPNADSRRFRTSK